MLCITAGAILDALSMGEDLSPPSPLKQRHTIDNVMAPHSATPTADNNVSGVPSGSANHLPPFH